MLIQFSFNNYKSFKDEAVLNLEALGTSKNAFYSHPAGNKTRVVKTAAVYGANASGKTKLFEAFRFLKSFICPPRSNDRVPMLDYWKILYDSFRLNVETANSTSFFEVVFLVDGVQYRYGVEMTAKEVVSEWLYKKHQREINVFEREKGKSIKFNKEQINSKIANSIISAGMVSGSSSFLVVLQTFNEPLANKVVDWFNKTIVISANDIRIPGESFSIPMMADDTQRGEIVNFLKAFDLNIEDAKLHELHVDEIPDKIKAIIGHENLKGSIYDGVNISHKLYNDLYEKIGNVWFSMEKDESYGTNRLFWLSSAIISAIKNGMVLFIDEYDSGIHPSVAKNIIELFYLCDSNAQLIINTQNASFLNSKTEENKKLFTKYQLFLVNKNRYGESSLTPFADFKVDLRSKLDELYLSGMIGGTPYINTEAAISLFKRRDNDERP